MNLYIKIYLKRPDWTHDPHPHVCYLGWSYDRYAAHKTLDRACKFNSLKTARNAMKDYKNPFLQKIEMRQVIVL